MKTTEVLVIALKPLGSMIGTIAGAQDKLIRLLASKGVITDEEANDLTSIVDRALADMMAAVNPADQAD